MKPRASFGLSVFCYRLTMAKSISMYSILRRNLAGINVDLNYYVSAMKPDSFPFNVVLNIREGSPYGGMINISTMVIFTFMQQ